MLFPDSRLPAIKVRHPTPIVAPPMIPPIVRIAAWLALGASIALASAEGQVAASLPAAPPSGAPTPTVGAPPAAASWLTGGGDVRLRNEYFNNAFTLSEVAPLHEQDYFRLRVRLWGSATLIPDLTFNVRVAAEPRIWERPAFVKQHTGTGTEERYVIPDTFNVKWTHAFGLPLTITAGRQDILLGDPLNWWLVCDGTPGDGSWTLFLDGVRATLDAPAIKTKFDLFAIDQHAKPDAWLPIIGAKSTYGLAEQDERGLVLYASNKARPQAQVDGYFIYKKDTRFFATGDNAEIYTLGAKLGGAPAPNWLYSIEGAWQWGWKQDPGVKVPVNVSGLRRDLQACALNARLSYSFKDPLNNQVNLVGEYLSGDKPGTTDRDEMFDILWGRWPRFSELYIYSYTMETGGKIAQLNNLLRVGAGWSCTPAKGTTFSATYQALFAPEDVPTRALSAALFSRNGHFRGHFLQLVLKHQFSKQLSGHLWAEFVREGDFYARRDTLTFLRGELLLTF